LYKNLIDNRDLFLDCQVNLYGSVYFECCLEKPGIMDIDVQFKETLQYDTLKELLDIIEKNGMFMSIIK
jgi:hypothetical protein